MKRELGIARCGLACCLCSENDKCKGCDEDCKNKSWCENRRCSLEKGIVGCYECEQSCQNGLLKKVKPQGFCEYIKRYGKDALLDALERNEEKGIVYHREGITGDYDDFTDVETLIKFINKGKKEIDYGRKD